MENEITALVETIEEQGATITDNTRGIDSKLPKTISAINIVRSLDTPFQVSIDSLAWVSYLIQLDNSFSIAGSKVSTVDLLIDSGILPTALRGRISLGGTVAAILSLLGLTDQTTTVQLCGWVEPGHYVLLSTSGTGTVSLIGQEERIFA